MKFSAVKESIVNYIQYANNFTSPKNLNTLLQNIYMSVEDNQLILKATNYQFGFTCSIDVDAVSSGAITVSGKKLLDIIKELPDGSLIDFNYDGSRLSIKSGKSTFKLSTLNPEGFPSISNITKEFGIKIDTNEFILLLKRIWFCISNESQKPEYTGAQINVYGNCLEIFATGLQRVAIASILYDSEFGCEFMVNVPKKTIQELIKILDGNSTVEIETDRNQISFKSGNITIYSKLIEKFVKGVSRLFNNEYPIKATLDTKEFINSAKRVSAISSDDTPGLILNFKDGVLKLASLENEYGEGNEVMEDIKCNIEEFEIILNAKHAIEILSNIETEKFTFEIIDRRSPVLITPESDRYRYLVVPMSIDKI